MQERCGYPVPCKTKREPDLCSRNLLRCEQGCRELRSPAGPALPLPWGPALWSWGGGAVQPTPISGPGDRHVCTHLCDAGEGRAPHLLTWRAPRLGLKDERTACPPGRASGRGAGRGSAHLWGCWRASPGLHLSRVSTAG